MSFNLRVHLLVIFFLIATQSLFAQSTFNQVGGTVNGIYQGENTGSAVAISDDGKTMVVGANSFDYSISDTGLVRVFKLDSGTWVQKGTDITGTEDNDYFGSSVAISANGEFVAIGAPGYYGGNWEVGHVKVYRFVSGTWVQQGAIFVGSTSNEQLGKSVSLSNNGLILSIGTPKWSNYFSNYYIGKVQVYELDTTSSTWTQLGSTILGENDFDQCGYTTSLSADGYTVSIGSPRNDNIGNDAGHVRIFQYDFSVSDWVQKGNDIDGEAADDYSGESMTMNEDGTRVAIGAWGNDAAGTDRGHVRVFEYDTSSSTWLQLGSDFDGISDYNYYVNTIDFNRDGSQLLIGDAGNDSIGSDAGQVTLYEYQSGNWNQVANKLNGANAGFNFGQSVSLADDSLYFAIGSPAFYINNGQEGQVKVFNLLAPDTTQPKIELTGNNIIISNGDNSPDVADNTHFGNNSLTNSLLKKYVIRNVGSKYLVISNLSISGTNSNLFTFIPLVKDTIMVGDSAILNIIYTPTSLGNHTATVTFNTSDTSAILFDFALEGKGISTGICNYDTVGNAINGEAQWDNSGNAVAMSANGKIVAIGAAYNAGGGNRRGHVRIYQNISGTWTQLGTDIDGEADNDESGRSISLSNDGHTIAIGSPNNAAGGTERGQVRIYKFNSGSWTQLGTDIEGQYDYAKMGYSVSISADGKTVAASSFIGNGGGFLRGEVRIYNYISSTWNLMGSVINGEADYDYSGVKISLSKNGLNIAIGSQTNAGGGYRRGHVRLFNYNGTSWVQKGADIDGQNNEEYSGSSVSVSEDGNTVAIGAPYNDELDKDNGVVRIYQFISGTWTQKGGNIFGELKENFFGTSLALNSMGNVVTVGAPYNDGNGNDAGQVRTYKFKSGNWEKIGTDLDGSNNNDNFGIDVAIDSIGNTIIGSAYNHHVQTGTYTYNYYAGQSKVYKLNCLGPEIVIKQNGKLLNNYYNSIDTSTMTLIHNITVGDSAIKNFTIYNTGLDTLKINNVSIQNGLPLEYKIKNMPMAISPDDSANFNVIYSPIEPIYNDVIVTIFNNDNDESEFKLRIVGTSIKSTNCVYGIVADEIINDSLNINQISMSSDGKTVVTYQGMVARVQTNINGSWVQLGADIPAIGTVYLWANSVTISGDATTVALGSPRYNGHKGIVKVYKFTSGAWVQQGSELTGLFNNHEFGQKLELSNDGQVLAVGSRIFNDSGAVYIYKFNGSNWVQMNTTIINNKKLETFALNGNGTVVATSHYIYNSTGPNTIKCNVFKFNSGTWAKYGSEIEILDNGFGGSGTSVDLSDDGLTLFAGGIAVFTHNGTDWVQKGNSLNPRWGLGFQNVISGDGLTLALGRFGLSSYAGAYAWGTLCVFKYINGRWLQETDRLRYKPEIDEDLFAYSLSISYDGSTIAASGGGYVKVLKYNCSASEIKVFGNNYLIEDGDNTPGIPDSTNFGISNIGVGVKHHFKIKNTGIDTLKILSINSTGINASDFIISNAPTAIKAGDSAAFDVTYTPTIEGVSYATITIESNAIESNTYNFDITGKTQINITSSCNFTQLGTDIDPKTTNGRLGDAMAANGEGNIVAIGSKTKDDERVLVYRYVNSNWTQLGQSLFGLSSEADDNAYFGSALALSNDGSLLAVGAPAGYFTYGSVKIYKLSGNMWKKQATVQGSGLNDGFGNSVSLSANGQIMAVGASNGGSLDKGYVRIFKNNNGTWTQLGADIIGENNNDLSGTNVTLNFDGNVVAIGAPKNDDAAANSGQVRVYKWIGGTWTLHGSDIDGLNSEEQVGQSISINSDGTILAIGVAGNSADTFRGKARVYQYNGSSWSQIGPDLVGHNIRDSFGYSVSVNGAGNIIAIGSPHNNNGGTLKGSTSVFKNTSSNWVALGTFVNGETVGDKSGSAVKLSLDGTRLTIGAPNNKGGSTFTSGFSGNFRVFDLNCNECKLTSPIPNSSGIFTSSKTNTDSGFTCYCDSSGKLLLALDLAGTGAVIPNNGVKLQIGSPTTIAWSDTGGIITHADGAAIFNRKWDVTATTQPSSSVKVKFFFTQTEYDSVRMRLSGMGNNTITTPSHLEMYKLSSYGFNDPHAVGAVGTIYTNAPSPSLSEWSYSKMGSNHCAEFLVSSFSGGGGGAALMPAIPLPLEFIKFSAKRFGQTSALLHWQTAIDVKNHYFEIERSFDGKEFNTIGTMNSNTTGVYQYIDNGIKTGTTKAFYRIKQLDENNESAETQIQQVQFNLQVSGINVYPNPATATININIASLYDGDVADIAVVDALGKVVLKQSTDQSSIEINLSNVSPGIYQLVVNTKTENKTIQFLKN